MNDVGVESWKIIGYAWSEVRIKLFTVEKYIIPNVIQNDCILIKYFRKSAWYPKNTKLPAYYEKNFILRKTGPTSSTVGDGQMNQAFVDYDG